MRNSLMKKSKFSPVSCLTYAVQDSHAQLRVAVEGLQLSEETPRRLLVHRIPSLWAVYPHGNQAPPALRDHRLSRRW